MQICRHSKWEWGERKLRTCHEEAPWYVEDAKVAEVQDRRWCAVYVKV
jgi:hypothetical protein